MRTDQFKHTATVLHVVYAVRCDAGGLLWFPDLTQAGLNLAALQAPLGPYGAALPACVALAMFANINRSFGGPPDSSGECSAWHASVHPVLQNQYCQVHV